MSQFFLLPVTLLLTHGDIGSNPGPKRRISNYFSCCHWNVNSIMAHNKLSLISACNIIHKYDIIWISESYLENTTDNNALSIDEYNLIRADDPNNQKKIGVCLYFREQLKLRQVNTTYFSECILSKITIRNQISYIVVKYCSFSQRANKLNRSISSFVILSDIHARSKSWWDDDIKPSGASQIEASQLLVACSN